MSLRARCATMLDTRNQPTNCTAAQRKAHKKAAGEERRERGGMRPNRAIRCATVRSAHDARSGHTSAPRATLLRVGAVEKERRREGERGRRAAQNVVETWQRSCTHEGSLPDFDVHAHRCVTFMPIAVRRSRSPQHHVHANCCAARALRAGGRMERARAVGARGRGAALLAPAGEARAVEEVPC